MNIKINELPNNGINDIDERQELLNQKMKELNKEIIKLKEERSKVNKIKVEYEKSMSKLNNDLYQFSQKKEEFESGIPQDIKNIDNRSIDSGFLDEDIKDNPNNGMINFIKDNNANNNNNKKSKDFFASIKTDKDIMNSNLNVNANENDTFNYKAAEKKADEFLREGLGDESEWS